MLLLCSFSIAATKASQAVGPSQPREESSNQGGGRAQQPRASAHNQAPEEASWELWLGSTDVQEAQGLETKGQVQQKPCHSINSM